MGWDGLFDGVWSFDSFPGVKYKKPDLLARLLADLGVDPADAVMVGDTLLDRHCAKNAGAGSVLVSWAPSINVHELEGEDVPDFILEEPGDLFEFV
jgi:phosphoglycolate phosphatase-like HAD superfamily hydrolase